MALTREDLQAIGELLKPIKDRLDVIEMKQDITSKKLNDLELDVKVSERNIRRDLHKLNDEMETVVEVLKQNDFIPL